MKKILFSFTVISALFSSCTVNEQKAELPVTTANGVTATFQQPVTEVATKALDNDLKFVFEEGDQIDVYSAAENECMVYGLTPSAESDSDASFVVKGFNLKSAIYSAVYPYMRPSLDPESIPFSLAGQNQSTNSDASHLSAYDLNYAQAEISDNSGTFAFDHQVAWLKIQIKSASAAETFKEVVVSADEGIANVITLNAVSGIVDATPASAAETVTLKLNGGKGIDVAKGGSLVAYVTIPAGEYTNLHIVCGKYSKTIDGAKLCEGGHVYPINLATKLPKPASSPAPGDYLRGAVITLRSAEGADIYYTLDGTTPTEASSLYNPEKGIVLQEAFTIKAIAVKDGWFNSDVMSAAYTVTKAPAPKISIDDNGVVTITSTLYGADIHYTLDGSHPNRSSALYSSTNKPVLPEGKMACVRAIVAAESYSDSDEGYSYYNCFDTLEGDELRKLSEEGRISSSLVDFYGYGTYEGSMGFFVMKYDDNFNRSGYINCSDYNYRIKSIRIRTNGSSEIEIYADDLKMVHLELLERIATVKPTYGAESHEAYYEFDKGVDYHTVEIRPAANMSVNVYSVTVELW